MPDGGQQRDGAGRNCLAGYALSTPEERFIAGKSMQSVVYHVRCCQACTSLDGHSPPCCMSAAICAFGMEGVFTGY